jgi:hypothetical protein
MLVGTIILFLLKRQTSILTLRIIVGAVLREQFMSTPQLQFLLVNVSMIGQMVNFSMRQQEFRKTILTTTSGFPGMTTIILELTYFSLILRVAQLMQPFG